ncbi:hypothetical protein [Robertmurraya siralis]|uniref:hypothetical protein n=1 Tax=Robertmurraya siralis TaxID=77777 RepID=UPI0010FA34A4|nr:hypothetical protein [Robertmurraya siralis]
MKTLLEKYNSLDAIVKLGSLKSMYFLIEKNEFAGFKTYSLKYLHIDEEAKANKLSEINEAIRNNEIEKNVSNLAKHLEVIDNKYQEDKFIEFGTIKCYLKNTITIDIQTRKHSKTFEFKQEDFLDELLNFLQKEINDEAKELVLSEDK